MAKKPIAPVPPVRAPLVSVIGDLEIEVTPTADGRSEYVQIRTPAAIPVNIVLVARHITITDRR